MNLKSGMGFHHQGKVIRMLFLAQVNYFVCLNEETRK